MEHVRRLGAALDPGKVAQLPSNVRVDRCTEMYSDALQSLGEFPADLVCGDFPLSRGDTSRERLEEHQAMTPLDERNPRIWKVHGASRTRTGDLLGAIQVRGC